MEVTPGRQSWRLDEEGTWRQMDKFVEVEEGDLGVVISRPAACAEQMRGGASAGPKALA